MVVRTDLPRAELASLELWELDEAGAKATRRRVATARLVAGRPDPTDLARARGRLEADARRAGLEIVRADW